MRFLRTISPWLLLFLVLLPTIKGCNNGLGRRRKRDVTELPFEAYFFGNCQHLTQVNNGIFSSLQSVVDSVIRDSNWYNIIKSSVCSGVNNVASCWISSLPLLLDRNSVFYRPTAQCICLWDPEGCWRSNFQAKKRRSILPDKNPENHRRIKRQSPSGLVKCLDRYSVKFINKYSSLKRFDGRSITTFLNDHYSYCRTIPIIPQKYLCQLELLYIDKVCPKEGSNASWRKDSMKVFNAYVRNDSPVKIVVDFCTKGGYAFPLHAISGEYWSVWQPVTECKKKCGKIYRFRAFKRSCMHSSREIPNAFCIGKSFKLEHCPRAVPCSCITEADQCISHGRYVYRTEKGRCERYHFGDCGKTENIFPSLEECEIECIDACYQELDRGPCQASMHRYYYNVDTNRCEAFNYGGCQGNQNNFLTWKDCHKCIKDTTIADELIRKHTEDQIIAMLT